MSDNRVIETTANIRAEYSYNIDFSFFDTPVLVIAEGEFECRLEIHFHPHSYTEVIGLCGRNLEGLLVYYYKSENYQEVDHDEL